MYLWLQIKLNQFSSNNSHHTSCIHKGLHAGTWLHLMKSKPDSVSSLGYHWRDQTGRPLEPQVHWGATGTTLADADTQCCSSGDPVLIYIIGTHWKTTGATSTLGCHWNHTVWCYHPVVSQWWSSVNLHNWNTLEHHWKHTGNTPATNNSFTSGILVYTGVYVPGTLDCHWITTGSGYGDTFMYVIDHYHFITKVMHFRKEFEKS